MPSQTQYPQRHTIRLAGYDHAREGAYFVTMCTHQRALVFEGARLRALVESAWQDLPRHYPNVSLDQFVVMPNHVHGILFIDDPDGRGGFETRPPGVAHEESEMYRDGNGRRHSLSEIVRAFKTFSARQINACRQTPGNPIWQRGYYEHVIRRERSLNRIREYIIRNPARWEFDRENPAGRIDGAERAFWSELSRPLGRAGLKPSTPTE